MEVAKYSNGMIFTCKDRCTNHEEPGSHNYLIISNRNNTDMRKLQCMGITSMYKKEIRNMEVPIILCNRYVSYIMPYNIFSMMESDIDIRNYKGIIADTDDISKDDFIKLLIDIYTYQLTGIDNTNIVDRYNEYCDVFWNSHNNSDEFRNHKEEMTTVTSVTKDETGKITAASIGPMISKKTNEPDPSRKFPMPESVKRKFYGNGEGKKPFLQNKEQNEENKTINKVIADAVKYNQYSLVDSDDEIPISDNKNVILTSKSELTPDMLSSIDNEHRFIKEWTDSGLILFCQLYEKYSLKELLPHCKRFTDPTSMSAAHTKCVNEAKNRGLNLTGNDPLKRPLSEWRDDELKSFLAIVENHKYDKKFIHDFCKFKSKSDSLSLVKNVKEEILNRAI